MSERSKTEQIVFDLVENIILSMGFELIDVEYVKEGGEWYLRLIIDKRGGISIDDCSDVSQAVEPVIDEADPVRTAYNLEVSSPGLDRPLNSDRDLERNLGELVEIHPKLVKGDKKWFEGFLQSVTEESVTIILDEPFIKGVKPKTNGQEKTFLRSELKLIKRAIRF